MSGSGGSKHAYSGSRCMSGYESHSGVVVASMHRVAVHSCLGMKYEVISSGIARMHIVAADACQGMNRIQVWWQQACI